MSTHTDSMINDNFARKVKATAAEILGWFKEWDELENQPVVAYIRSGEYDKVLREFTILMISQVRADRDTRLAETYFEIWEAGHDDEHLIEALRRLYRNHKWQEVLVQAAYEWECLVVAIENAEGLTWPSDGVSAD